MPTTKAKAKFKRLQVLFTPSEWERVHQAILKYRHQTHTNVSFSRFIILVVLTSIEEGRF